MSIVAYTWHYHSPIIVPIGCIEELQEPNNGVGLIQYPNMVLQEEDDNDVHIVSFHESVDLFDVGEPNNESTQLDMFELEIESKYEIKYVEYDDSLEERSKFSQIAQVHN